MKITLLTVGSMGDVRPYIALGVGLKAAGFEATVATHLEFESLIRSQGLNFAPVRGNPREMLQSPEGQAMIKSGTNMFKFAERMRAAAALTFDETCDDCVAACQGADAVIFAFLTAGVVAMIAKATKIKTIAGYLQPLTPTGAFAALTMPTLYLGGFLNRLSHKMGYWILWYIFRPLLETWSKDRLGLRPPKLHPYTRLEQSSLVLYGYSRLLVPRPADWPANVHVTGYWQLPEGEGFEPSAELAAFLANGAPPIYVGFGSMSGEDPARLTTWVIEAVKASGRRGILLGGWGGLVEQELPPEILHIDHAPHDWLFPQLAGVVHHGGAGTTHAGLAAGVPGLAIPFFGDQAFW
ncbi:MAG: glycosyltransferase, partial [Candidatus Sericytochromatia bacterium]